MSPADGWSLARAILGPPFALFLAIQILSPGKYLTLTEHYAPLTSLLLFLFLASTDAIDGWVAKNSKKYGPTRFGAFLDPLADKIFIWSYSAALAFTVAWNAIPVLFFLFFLDVASTAERVIKYNCPEKEMAANQSGKKKTVCHFTAIGLFMLTLIFYPESARSDVKFWSAWTSVLGWIILLPALLFSGCSLWEKWEQWRS